MHEIINSIGFYGPIILLFFSFILLSSKSTLLITYLVGFVLNSIINIILKLIIKQPRPSENPKTFLLSLLHNKIISFDKYGMPSGHAQSMFYSTVFIYLVFKKKWITFVMFLLSIITLIQRVVTNSHNVLQIMVGSIIGSIIGYFFFYFATNKIKGILRMKKDDNAPI